MYSLMLQIYNFSMASVCSRLVQKGYFTLKGNHRKFLLLLVLLLIAEHS